ncbi:DUF1294 domain-containing protein [Bacillus sp. B15-48]|uniref:DUF1294 domain-containing protein n=1 Tax=Bacillus sp. B15-48 TaxID=1548601 RepID=UPI00193ECDEC|nr:DUF1294 domain-containing protein [Bacillus sp. B15-48]MBM4762510.1 DUF1294 domain-containing protein [Bacillus sp. B15-48]
MSTEQIFLIGLLIMNVFGYFLMKVDKQRAKQKEYRVSEKRLWLIAILGGALGMTIGMNRYRHKTKHLQFKLGLPILTILQLSMIVLFSF